MVLPSFQRHSWLQPHIVSSSKYQLEYIELPEYLLGTFGRTADTLTVRVGATTNYEGGDIHTVAKVISHPKYNVVTFDFDVALLQLEKSIAINNITKQEISLPFQGEALPENTPVLVSGWGNY